MKYLPKEEEDSSADLIFKLLEYRQFLNKEGIFNESYEKQFKELITTLLWKHTEAYGKYIGCKFWSTGALQSFKKHNNKVVTSKAIDSTGALRHEHLFPRKQSINLLLELSPPTLNSVKDLLKLNIGVIVTVEEDDRLPKVGDQLDPWKRYRDANVTWQKVK